MSESFQFYFPAPDPPPTPPPADPNTLEHYRLMALALLPRGKAFARSVGSAVSDLLEGCMAEFARIDAAAHELLDAALPDRAVAYLEDWEDVLGLPLPWQEIGTLSERQQFALRRLLRRSGNNRAAYDEAMASLGLELQAVHSHSPFEVGRSAAGDALTNDVWAYAFTLDVSNDDGTAPTLDQMAQLDTIIRALLQRAHTHVVTVPVTG